MTRQRLHFFFLNLGHFYDHMFMLVFATVAALSLSLEWGMSYAQLIPYALPGFIAFGAFALPAGWLADKWSREGMMAVFFIGIGISSVFTALAETPLQIGLGIFAMGVFAAIYHPVGIPLVIHGREKTGVPIAINGIYGNLGVASAALVTGFMIDNGSWRSAFVWPGLVSIATGLAYTWLVWPRLTAARERVASKGARSALDHGFTDRATLVRMFAIVLITTALGGIVFQSTTFALPKIFDERLAGIAVSATLVGWYTFLAFALAALAQLVVGYMLDNHSLRTVFLVVAASQVTFLAMMPGLQDWMALVVAVAFMLAVFGQIPINDVLVGRITRSEWRSRVFACRYVVTFSGVAVAIPMISWVHANWSFDTLFWVLAAAASLITAAVLMLPRAIPRTAMA
ncbi:MAG: MFS transporter [Methyloligellaceae bacterium]